jgi:hypothetical protein
VLCVALMYALSAFLLIRCALKCENVENYLTVYGETQIRCCGNTGDEVTKVVSTKITKQTVMRSNDVLIALKTLAVQTGKTQDEVMRAAIESYLMQKGALQKKDRP